MDLQATKQSNGVAMESKVTVNVLLQQAKAAMAAGDRSTSSDNLNQATKVSPLTEHYTADCGVHSSDPARLIPKRSLSLR